MQSKLCSGIVCSAVALSVACGSSPLPPPEGVSSTQSAPEPVASVPTATPAATAAPSAPPPAFLRVAVDAASMLSRLSKEAAAYGWVRPVALDEVIGWSRQRDDVRDLMKRQLGADTVLAILRDVGIEPGAPVAFSIVGGDVAAADKRLTAAVSSKDPRATNQPPIAPVHARFVAQTIAGVDVVARAADVLARGRLKVIRCAGDAPCAVFGKNPPALVATGPDLVAAASVKDGRLELDVVVVDGAPDARLGALAKAMEGAPGGPAGRCGTLDPDADLSVCVDAERTGQLGAAAGLTTTASVLALVDPPQRKKIAAQGKAESMRNVELSKPPVVLLDDGTVSAVATRDQLKVTATWKTTPASAAKVEAQLAQEKCFDGTSAFGLAAPELTAMFPDPGKGFGKDRISHLREAGFAAPLILLGRTWPNFVALGLAERVPDLNLRGATLCLSSASGRLQAKATLRDIALP